MLRWVVLALTAITGLPTSAACGSAVARGRERDEDLPGEPNAVPVEP